MVKEVVGILVCLCLSVVHCELLVQPEQVHVSYTSTASELMVTWVTRNITELSQVQYGQSATLDLTAAGNATLFIDGGDEHRSMWIHRVLLKNLESEAFYAYHVGSPEGWSDLFYFKVRKAGPDWSPVIAIYGDMGNVDAVAMASLQKEAQSHSIDSVLHIGDFAYDMDTENARVGDAFMNQIQAVAAYVPYMTCPGNHEQKYNFSNYKNRFTMPNTHGDGLYFSYNTGPAHIISISTEVYYYDTYNITGGLKMVADQYKWLQLDLQEANKYRSVRPWLIVVGHRPMYCSNSDRKDEHCNNLNNNLVRTGLPKTHKYNLEDLFYKAGVDLQFYAHEHSYERLWPVYNMTVCNGTKSAYENPRAPVHIVTGSAGNDEGQTGFDKPPYPWSAFHTDDFGYTKMYILNGTHISMEQISIPQGKVIDRMMLNKNKHGPGLYDCH